ncbi:MAG: histidine triad family protein [Actinomycetota bacterium]|nr:histidine triad family protein [Actinomycetota bacterium]
MTDCLFCRIASGEIPTTFVAQNDRAVAFDDIHPAAPTHVLVIPRAHCADVAALGARLDDLAAVVQLAATVAEQTGVATTGWRLVFNTGSDAGQSVFHAHAHVVGGRRLSPNAG